MEMQNLRNKKKPGSGEEIPTSCGNLNHNCVAIAKKNYNVKIKREIFNLFIFNNKNYFCRKVICYILHQVRPAKAKIKISHLYRNAAIKQKKNLNKNIDLLYIPQAFSKWPFYLPRDFQKNLPLKKLTRKIGLWNNIIFLCLTPCSALFSMTKNPKIKK